MYPSSLMARVLKAKYISNSNFLEANIGNNASYVWRSIVSGRELLKEGLRWRIGDDKNVLVFKDPWISRPTLFQPISRPSLNTENLKISGLMSPFGWHKEKLESILLLMDQELVWSIPSSSRQRPDRRCPCSALGGGSDSNWWRKLWRSVWRFGGVVLYGQF
ncbi:hypothetical protein TIFTF001_016825 [Ficus carica]|uniref:Reverse transcriptase n=1 Tax=Ficus carica TaxID=3494 RepID=A0AA88A123_FICCA|nr:hypothetical protein TIFTF001_016825 [Ficus carica]